MLFFALIVVVTLLAHLVSRLGVPGLADWRACMRWGLALALVSTGVDHLVTPGRYLPMMPWLRALSCRSGVPITSRVEGSSSTTSTCLIALSGLAFLAAFRCTVRGRVPWLRLSRRRPALDEIRDECRALTSRPMPIHSDPAAAPPRP